jgi:hypothetical protein
MSPPVPGLFVESIVGGRSVGVNSAIAEGARPENRTGPLSPGGTGSGAGAYSIKFQRLPTLLTAAAATPSNPNALPNPDIHQFNPVPSARWGDGKGTVMTVPLARTSRCS